MTSPHTLPQSTSPFDSVNKAFSKQSLQYDAEDQGNMILQDLRLQVYNHVVKFVKQDNRILELNAGTGIDALHFIRNGCSVHATDLSDGMINQIKRKIDHYNISDRLTYQQVSYENLNQVTKNNFDFAFSNFGGLNCSSNLSKITCHLPQLLKPGAYVTVVIMPAVCPWELLQFAKGRVKKALRRFSSGVESHLEGEYFKTYYFSLFQIKKAFGKQFTFIKSEGLASLSPPPHRGDIPQKSPFLYKILRGIDSAVRDYFPFNRWADHIIVTFQFTP